MHFDGHAACLDGLNFCLSSSDKKRCLQLDLGFESSRKMFIKMFYTTYQNFRIFGVDLLFISNGFMSLRNCPVWTRFYIFFIFLSRENYSVLSWYFGRVVWYLNELICVIVWLWGVVAWLHIEFACQAWVFVWCSRDEDVHLWKVCARCEFVCDRVYVWPCGTCGECGIKVRVCRIGWERSVLSRVRLRGTMPSLTRWRCLARRGDDAWRGQKTVGLMRFTRAQ